MPQSARTAEFKMAELSGTLRVGCVFTKMRDRLIPLSRAKAHVRREDVCMIALRMQNVSMMPGMMMAMAIASDLNIILYISKGKYLQRIFS